MEEHKTFFQHIGSRSLGVERFPMIAVAAAAVFCCRCCYHHHNHHLRHRFRRRHRIVSLLSLYMSYMCEHVYVYTMLWHGMA